MTDKSPRVASAGLAKDIVVAFCASISLLAMAAGVIGGGLLFFSPEGGGFFAGLGKVLGGLAFGAGCLVSFICNLVCWWAGKRPRWLAGIMVIQSLPALGFGAWLLSWSADERRDKRIGFQTAALFDAIDHDDVKALMQAREKCEVPCMESVSSEKMLMVAAEQGAQGVVGYLVAAGAPIGKSWYDRRSLRTCEGLYLPALSALGIAVALNDMAMVHLLMPASDLDARREAMWVAAKLDRFDLMMFLVENGVPLDMRGGVLDSNNTLLVAASEGAALRVGRWLIQERRMPVDAIANGPDPYPGTAPVAALYQFIDATGSARGAAFLRMLKENGANLDVPVSDRSSMLEDAVSTGRKNVAQILIDGGADASHLPPASKTALDELMAGPDRPSYPQETEGCIAQMITKRKPDHGVRSPAVHSLRITLPAVLPFAD
ncbi:hypothetical protein [Agrobacterium sp. NPDC089420]|uniref:hypothetical protein n=1 Tax=Agrobacterium sp. NPDC089420 TaxID=3363918 RepID=UPI0038507CFE